MWVRGLQWEGPVRAPVSTSGFQEVGLPVLNKKKGIYS